MWQWHCTKFRIFAFDVTGPMLHVYRHVTYMYCWCIDITFYFFTFYFFLLFSVILLFYGLNRLMPEIKMD